ncbi:MAG: sulfurtransferase [Bacteroidota bacterium]
MKNTPLPLPGPLVSVDWLHSHLGHPALRLFDATIPKVGTPVLAPGSPIPSIPSAHFLDLKGDFADPAAALPNTFPSVDQLVRAVGALGIRAEQTLVIYDRHGIYSSPRARWILRTLGHERVAVLDGGLPAWLAAGYATEPLRNDRPERVEATWPVLRGAPLVTAADLRQQMAVAHPATPILDARSRDRFEARVPEPRPGLRGGHIPGSQSLPYAEVLEGGKLKDRESLRRAFADRLGERTSMILSCGSGITACVLGLAAETAGYPDYQIYDGSWTEWATDPNNPIET